MTEKETPTTTDRERLPPKTITDRFDELSAGDEITINNRETPYEVIETDRYSVTVSDPDGNHITLSQNLQTGGWVVHEEIWWVGAEQSGD
ncbi:transcriptional regulator [Natronococcus pandeyae]|uniref:Transcriptional regulator n=1 Tax=Natronococcus pandeyae TaxID=2055836 RepID=A0A8J8Q3C1_9EURY|nr:transcriptional regulator [Natronococcus pandeyae]TYL36914.1 transcriptional regulator [Natronococcus pandeyae]